MKRQACLLVVAVLVGAAGSGLLVAAPAHAVTCGNPVPSGVLGRFPTPPSLSIGSKSVALWDGTGCGSQHGIDFGAVMHGRGAHWPDLSSMWSSLAQAWNSTTATADSAILAAIDNAVAAGAAAVDLSSAQTQVQSLPSDMGTYFDWTGVSDPRAGAHGTISSGGDAYAFTAVAPSSAWFNGYLVMHGNGRDNVHTGIGGAVIPSAPSGTTPLFDIQMMCNEAESNSYCGPSSDRIGSWAGCTGLDGAAYQHCSGFYVMNGCGGVSCDSFSQVFSPFSVGLGPNCCDGNGFTAHWEVKFEPTWSGTIEFENWFTYANGEYDEVRCAGLTLPGVALTYGATGGGCETGNSSGVEKMPALSSVPVEATVQPQTAACLVGTYMAANTSATCTAVPGNTVPIISGSVTPIPVDTSPPIRQGQLDILAELKTLVQDVLQLPGQIGDEVVTKLGLKVPAPYAGHTTVQLPALNLDPAGVGHVSVWPFSTPWDLLSIVSALDVAPRAPTWSLDWRTPTLSGGYVTASTVSVGFTEACFGSSCLQLLDYDIGGGITPIVLIRWGELMVIVVGVALRVRDWMGDGW